MNQPHKNRHHKKRTLKKRLEIRGKANKIYNLLMEGEAITQLDVVLISTRLSAYVHTLRTRHQVPIEMDLIPTKGGALVGLYYLPKAYRRQFQ